MRPRRPVRTPPPWRRSLRAALTWRLMWLSATVIVVGTLVVGIPYASDRELLETELVDLRMTAFDAAIQAAPGPPSIGHRERRLFEAYPESYGYAVLDAEGRVVEARGLDLIPTAALQTGVFAKDWLSRLDSPTGRLLVASHAVDLPGGVVRVVFAMASDPAGLRRGAVLHELLDHAWAPMAPVVALLVIANALMIWRGLAPVARAAAWARAVRPGVPPPPFPEGPMPAEVGDLVDAARRALDRLQAALDAETQRAAEAAHALRTPVAVLAARLDALAPGVVADRLRADVAALGRMVTQLLASARAEAAPASDEAVDLARLAEEVAAEVAPFAIMRGGSVAVADARQGALARGTPEPMRLALRNLVENAVIHGGGQVEVTAGPGPRLTVRDEGPGLPPEAAEAAFRPFWRGEAAEPGGAGLGLAIVARVQVALGGTVELGSAPGGGAEIRLTYRPA